MPMPPSITHHESRSIFTLWLESSSAVVRKKNLRKAIMMMKLSNAVLLAATATSVANAFVAVPQAAAPSMSMIHRFETARFASVSEEILEGAQVMIDSIIDEKNCNPVFVRLAWHDSGTYDDSLKTETWPKAGGATGSIRFAPEIKHGANAGLAGAVALLEPVKTAFPDLSYADLFQMASARSILLAGGPIIDMKYGRVDASGPDDCSPEGNLPDGNPGPDGKYGGAGGTKPTEDTTPNGHLRKVFYRMGLNDEEITALSGAHTFGRAYKDRSGAGAEKTKYTDGTSTQILRSDGKEAKYQTGGSSWTKQWLVFDNSYFQTIPDPDSDPELLKLKTDCTLFDDEGFAPFAEKFRDSQEAFFESYAKAHKKLSELGSKFD